MTVRMCDIDSRGCTFEYLDCTELTARQLHCLPDGATDCAATARQTEDQATMCLQTGVEFRKTDACLMADCRHTDRHTDDVLLCVDKGRFVERIKSVRTALLSTRRRAAGLRVI